MSEIWCDIAELWTVFIATY